MPTKDKPRQISAHAQILLNLLGRAEFAFRPLPESAMAKHRYGETPPRLLTGSLKKHAKALQSYNEHGCGIFVQVNANDGRGNRVDNITSCPCFFVDSDGAPLENLQRLALPPHAIFQTSKGKYHAYWTVADIPIDNFKATQQRVVALFETDHRVVDLPRLMRLPGFLHMKNPDEPQLVEPIQINDAPPFAYADFIAALAEAEVKHPPKPTKEKVFLKQSADIDRTGSAVRFLVDKQIIDIADYDEWLRLAFALKHSHGEEGFELWHEISKNAAGYVDVEDCRSKWESIMSPVGPPLTIATYFALATENGFIWKDPGRTKKAKSPDPAVVALQLVLEAGDEFWISTDGKACATFLQVSPDGVEQSINASIRSEAYTERLSSLYHENNPYNVLTKTQCELAKGLLVAKAKKGARHEVHLRAGKHGDAVFIDLCRADGQKIRVTKSGWSIVPDAPVRFLHRSGGIGELPLPAEGASVQDFHRHFNLSQLDVIKAIGIMLAALYGLASYPIGLIEGSQGTYKSTLGDMMLSLVDPMFDRKLGRASLPRKEDDLAVRAAHAHMLFFDNISTVDQNGSDAMCRIATGGAVNARVLYSDAEEHTLALLRPIIATCIGIPTARGDLLDRCVNLTSLPVGRRRTEDAVWSEFENDRPKMFGFLLDLMVVAMQNENAVQTDIESGIIGLPRMADYAALVEAVCVPLGLQPGEFSKLLCDAQRSVQAEAALGNPVVMALHDYFSKPDAKPISMTARELLQFLKPDYQNHRQNWPAPSHLKKNLNRNADGLKSLGITFEIVDGSGHDNVCRYNISCQSTFVPTSGLPPHKLPF